MKWGKYLLSDFFDIKTTKSVDKNKIEFQDNAPYDFIGRTSTDWGVQGTVDKLDFPPNPKDSFSLVQVGETVALWREKEWYASQNLFLLQPKLAKIKDVFLYFQTVINKEMSLYGKDYNSYPTMKSLNKTHISLPVKTKYVPDVNLMSEIIGGGISMSNIDTSSWKKFKLDELFDIENTWNYGKNKQYKSQLKDKIGDSIAVVSGITTNNGINYYTEDILDDNEIYNDCLTISTRGEYSGSVFYHDYPFALANNILTMPMPGLSKEAKLFMAAVIQALPFGGYGNYPTKDKLKESIIKLPVKESEEIDWEYMQERITELEQERITELEQYLIATGLNDYELTDEDKEILATKLTGGGVLQNSISGNGCLKEARIFRVGDLFEVKTPVKKFNANAVEITDRIGHPYVVRSSANNGIRGYIDEDEAYLNEGNTFSFGQDTATIFWQEKPYFTGDKIKVLKPKFECNSEIASYVMNGITKAFSHFSWGTQSFKVSVIEDGEFLLPVTCDGTPDWTYMEKYIRAIEKVVIKDVVDYKDSIITKTKEIIA